MQKRTVEIHRVHPQNTDIVSKRTVITVEQGDKIKNVKSKFDLKFISKKGREVKHTPRRVSDVHTR